MDRYPTVADLEARAARRVPYFGWAYLTTGTGAERGLQHNLEAFHAIKFMPRFAAGTITPKLNTKILGQSFDLPFGIAPVGLSSLMWPGMEVALATTAQQYNIPYSLSTVASESIEVVGEAAQGKGWFQLYPPRVAEIRDDLLWRAAEAGYKVLMVTVDVPVSSRRERMRRVGLTMPPKPTPKMLWHAAVNTAWGLATLKRGRPRFKILEPYAPAEDMANVTQFINDSLLIDFSWEELKRIRERWQGPLLIKGILHPDDAKQALECGCDGVIVSNHGARQMDNAPASIDALPAIRQAVGPEVPLILDSGVRSGLDIARSLAYGADFVMLGRAFQFGVAALGTEQGGQHVVEILKDELINTMKQIGCDDLTRVQEYLY